MPEEESQKKELLGLLSEAPATASLVEKLAQDLQNSAHLVGELAPAVREYVEQVPATSLTPEEWSHQIKGWRSFNEFAGKVATSVPPSVSFSATSYATTSSSNTVIFVTSGVDPDPTDAERRNKDQTHSSSRPVTRRGTRLDASTRTRLEKRRRTASVGPSRRGACFSRDRANPPARHSTGKHLGGDQPVEQAKTQAGSRVGVGHVDVYWPPMRVVPLGWFLL